MGDGSPRMAATPVGTPGRHRWRPRYRSPASAGSPSYPRRHREDPVERVSCFLSFLSPPAGRFPSAPIRVPALFPEARRTALDSERPFLCNAVGKLGRTPVRHVLQTCERVRLGVGRWALAPPCGESS